MNKILLLIILVSYGCSASNAKENQSTVDYIRDYCTIGVYCRVPNE